MQPQAMLLSLGTVVKVIGVLIFSQISFSNAWIEPALMDMDPQLAEKLNTAYWQKHGVDTLRKKLKHLENTGFTGNNKKRAKNVILFLGDGHGTSSVTATRKFKEQFSGLPFYENQLLSDSFPFTGFSKTYGLDTVIPESAGTATAYLTGVKTRQGFIGLDATGDLNCINKTKGRIESIAARAVRAGKVAGFVTTTSITDASPSPVYANMPSPLRYYQHATEKYAKSYPKCEDLAKQFVKKGHFLKVVMGGGRAHFTPNTVVPEGDLGKYGFRNDGRNLIEEWKLERWSHGTTKPTYVTNRDELLHLDPKSVGYVLGLFSHNHMTSKDENPPSTQPTLSEMTAQAIRILRENKDGFFLFVEGGLIDHAHHAGIARTALTEGIELDKAVETALNMTDPSETLIVVTADHSHTLTISGYLPHNSSILGVALDLADDNKPYTALMYAGGPGAYPEMLGPDGKRRNDAKVDTAARGYKQQSLVPLPYEGHAGEDVPVYANGIHSELFTGVFEQSYLTWAMSCAGGIHYGPLGTVVEEMKDLCPIGGGGGGEWKPQQPSPAVKTARKNAGSSNYQIASGMLILTLMAAYFPQHSY